MTNWIKRLLLDTRCRDNRRLDGEEILIALKAVRADSFYPNLRGDTKLYVESAIRRAEGRYNDA